VADYAQKTGIAPNFYYFPGSGPDDGIVNSFLCISAPIILATNAPPYNQFGHYVVATGQSGVSGWNINDPGYFGLTTIPYASYQSYRKYGNSLRDPSSMFIAVHSPVELLITDPAGRQTGYDPNTGQILNGIIDAEYRYDELSSDDGSRTILTRVFEVGTPISGTYSVELIGTGSGPFKIDFVGNDSTGTASVATLSGAIGSTTRVTTTVGYSNAPGAQISVTQPLPITFLPMVSR
jgi:hypothetical protein